MDLEAQIAAINAKYAPLLVNAGNQDEPNEAKRIVNAQKAAEILAVRNAAAAASSDTTGGGTKDNWNAYDAATGTYSHAGKTGLTQAEYQASVAAAQAAMQDGTETSPGGPSITPSPFDQFQPPEFGTGVFDPNRQQTNLDKVNQELADLYAMDRTQYEVDYQPVTELPEGVSEPAEGADVTGEGETFYNPKTGQTYTTPNSGYSVPEGGDWVKGTPEGKFNSYDVALAAKTKEQQAASLAAMGEGQQDLVSTAIKSPEDLAQEAAVAKIDPDTTGTEIATSFPRDYKQVGFEEAGFTPPPADAIVTQALETFHNPTTGEEVTVATGGYTAPEGWVKGAAEGQFQAAGPGDAGKTTDITAKTITDGVKAKTPDTITAATYDATQSTDRVKQALEGGVDFQTMIDNINVATRGGDPNLIGAISWDATAGKFRTAGTEDGYDQTGMPIVGMPPKEYTPEEFAKEFDTPLVTTEGVKAADGDVTKSVTGAVGTLSEGAKPVGATMDPDFDADIAAGKRVILEGSKELSEAQGQDAEAIKTAISEGEAAAPIKAAQTTVGTKEIAKAAQIAEKDMATAEAMTMDGLADDAVAVAKKMEAFTIDDGTLAEFKEGKIEAQDTVQGQLTSLMASFDDGTPSWAAGAMRAANEAMATRGLSGSSMAAAAIVQAAMESALPIAVQDADTFRSMKLDNLGRQQQIALTNAAAQQGVKLQNFTAEQTAMLQNSQNAFSLQTQNLSNMQAAVIATAQIKASLQGKNLDNLQQANLAEAARYAEVNNLNLNNRQQALLQDSLNNTQVSLANLSNKQQAYTTDANLAASLQGKQIDNKQQVAVLNSAKYMEANNLSFSSEEREELHNSELMTSIGLAELSNKQAATLQKAAAFASMDMANLSNQQQAQVENARNFLQMDLANLSNEQQVEIFKAQSIQQSILSDTAASNAAKQFNASSENQTNQFMADLKSTTDRFNVTQANAIKQFNVSEENAIATFNKEQSDSRDEFNTKNALVVAQSNAAWRQSVATADTAAQNEANMQLAKTENAFTASTLDQVWQRERDLLSYAWQADNNSLDRINSVILEDMRLDTATSNNAATNAASERNARAVMYGQIGGALVKGIDLW